jgi:hypothetical protein
MNNNFLLLDSEAFSEPRMFFRRTVRVHHHRYKVNVTIDTAIRNALNVVKLSNS